MIDDGRAAGAPALLAARALRARVRERAAEIEEQRRLPPDLVEELRAAGLFELLVPIAQGAAADPVTAARVVEEVAEADGSAGWCVMISAQNNSFSGYLPEDDVRAIRGERRIVAGTARPIGRAAATADPAEGYTVSGRWPFASGSSHADWFAAECTVYDGDRERLDADGNAVTRMLFVPRSEVTLHDTWHTTGLRGTASNDFSIDGAFVPAARGFQMLVDAPRVDSPIDRALPLLFMNHGSQALGVARAALAAAAELAKSKRGWGGVSLADVPRQQASLAEAVGRRRVGANVPLRHGGAAAGNDAGRARRRRPGAPASEATPGDEPRRGGERARGRPRARRARDLLDLHVERARAAVPGPPHGRGPRDDRPDDFRGGGPGPAGPRLAVPVLLTAAQGACRRPCSSPYGDVSARHAPPPRTQRRSRRRDPR